MRDSLMGTHVPSYQSKLIQIGRELAEILAPLTDEERFRAEVVFAEACIAHLDAIHARTRCLTPS
jgi:hypothetical protein